MWDRPDGRASNAELLRLDDPERPVAALDAASVAARVGEARAQELHALAVQFRDRRHDADMPNVIVQARTWLCTARAGCVQSTSA